MNSGKHCLVQPPHSTTFLLILRDNVELWSHHPQHSDEPTMHFVTVKSMLCGLDFVMHVYECVLTLDLSVTSHSCDFSHKCHAECS